ncbi:MAG: hypothetical protein KAS32_31490 [Candidatus Peribacteraceae bacterium]|nr:hypothetical protein [Candidatus Peribacteraceae bacterium]
MTNRPILLTIAVILLIFGVFAYGYMSTSVSPGTVTGASKITELDGTSYVYITVDKDQYDNQDVGMIKTVETDQVPIKDATNSDGKSIEGTFHATFDIKILDTGWRARTTKYTTVPFIDEAWLESSWISKTFKYNYGDPIAYNHVTSDMSPLARYQVTATINGKEYSPAIIDDYVNGLVEIPGTDPIIYWDEISYGLDGSSKVPVGLGNVDIVHDSNNHIYFLKQDMTRQAVEYWNAIMEDDGQKIQRYRAIWNVPSTSEGWSTDINRRIYLDSDDEYDIKSETPVHFTVNDLLSNDYRYKNTDTKSTWGVVTGTEIDFPSGDKYPFTYTKSSAGYTMSNPDSAYITREGDLSIQGVFRVPAEYGDVRVVTRTPDPEIIGTPVFTEDLYKDTTSTLVVSVRNNGDTGQITVTPTSNVQIELPNPLPLNVQSGETVDFELVFKTTTVTAGDINVYAQGGGKRDSVVVHFTVKEDIPVAEKYRIVITAVDKSGNALGTDFPIFVSQTSTRRYGTWIGYLSAGKTLVSGDQLVHDDTRYYPQDFTYTVTNDAEIEFVYTIEESEPVNWTTYIIIGLIVAISIGMVMYLKEDN